MYQLHEAIKERMRAATLYFPEDTDQDKIIKSNSQLKQLMIVIIKHVSTTRSTRPQYIGYRPVYTYKFWM
jgi:hypothetical protein